MVIEFDTACSVHESDVDERAINREIYSTVENTSPSVSVIYSVVD
jgi:hypothetical protein